VPDWIWLAVVLGIIAAATAMVIIVL